MGESSLETGEVTPLQPKESSPSLPWIPLQCGVAVSTLHRHRWKDSTTGFTGSIAISTEGGRKVRIVQGKSWLMEIWTDGGTQGRGLLEEEDPKGVSTY